jgi:lysophospholipase L1-like esterase
MSSQAGSEADDPYCLRAGEAAVLLAGHPWRRFVAVGDSVVSGEGDPVPGYSHLSWVDRIAAELAAVAPLDYLNLGQRDLLAADVRTHQLAPALDFDPDLALVACGANDALRAAYRPDQVDEELAAIISPMRQRGADVITVGLFDTTYAPAIPPRVKHLIGARMRTLSQRTARLADELGTIHVNVTGHPSESQPGMHSADGLHGNRRSHAICAAEAIRRLGAHLGNAFPADAARPRDAATRDSGQGQRPTLQTS